MTRWIKKIHMYTGLLNFSALVIFGVVGIAATVLPPPPQRPKPEPQVEVQDFPIPGGMGDRQLADHIQASLNIPLTGPAPDWSLSRDAENNLRFRLPTPARAFVIQVLEKENRIRVRTEPFDAWQFLMHLHEMTPSWVQPDPLILAWAWYIELSIWSLILMAVSGVYLWLASRPRYRWAQVSFTVGTAIFIAFFVFIR